MPRYKCHKEVWALKIKAIEYDCDKARAEGRDTDGSAIITPEEDGYMPFKVGRDYVDKQKPEVGGYYVAHYDGFKSFSMGQAFTEDHSLMEIKINDRFDTLTNLDISTHYRDQKFYLFPSSFMSAFAYWVTKQNPNEGFIDLRPSMIAYKAHVDTFFENPEIPVLFSFDKVKEVVNDDIFEKIPEILALNTMKPDFIDLGALARNVFYMVMREYITQS
jgi:hypothetical protein